VRIFMFSDLDGTLLDAHTYDWRAAHPGLDALRTNGIPLILTSSKTRAEIDHWRGELGLNAPFLCENGGAICFPRGGSPELPAGTGPAGDDRRLPLGTPYAVLRTALAEISRELGVALRGFGDMDVEEIAARCGLPQELAALASVREFDEPFVPARSLDAGEEVRLAAAAAARRLRITRGGRFHHLMGPNDKGRAARRLVELYAHPEIVDVTAAVGDGVLRVGRRPLRVHRGRSLVSGRSRERPRGYRRTVTRAVIARPVHAARTRYTPLATSRPASSRPSQAYSSVPVPVTAAGAPRSRTRLPETS
jgi:mannosyl-3-phosphoglycerate phosphatase